MENYSIKLKKSVEKDLNNIPQQDLHRIIKKIQDLSADPRPQGTEKLANYDLYRVRQGNYRIIYTINDKIIEICIIKVGHRKEIYRF